GWSAAVDTGAVAMAPVADQAAPGAVGRALIAAVVAWPDRLGIAAHALVERVDDAEAVDRCRDRHRRIERNFLAEARLSRGSRDRGHHFVAQVPIVRQRASLVAALQRVFVGAC